MILFRVDGNKDIGTGHIMRCLSVANALRNLHEKVVFVMADDSMQDIVQKHGFPVEILRSDYRNLNAEIESILTYMNALGEKEPRLLVVDSYFVTKQYFTRLRECVKVAYIDDLQEIQGCVDYAINYNVFADEALYRDCVTREALLGCSYIPLRDEFLNPTCVIRPKCHKILLTTGGADLYNISTKVLRCMFSGEYASLFKSIELHVIVGMFHQHKDELVQVANEHSNIVLHQNVNNMGELMMECDLAITAAGSTIYELSCMGVPSISFSFADNQNQAIEKFEELEGMKSAGYYLKNPEGMIEEVVALTKELVGDYEERVRLSQTAQALVDGKGAQRIARAMQSWCSV